MMKPIKRHSITLGSMPIMAGISLAAVILLICNLNSASNQLAEARYLPTRSDQTEVDALKSIIRGLLIEVATPPRQHSNHFQQLQEPIGLDLPRPNYLQRRAAEMTVSSSNGDDSDGYLTGSFAPLASSNTGQLFKQASSKPDRR